MISSPAPQKNPRYLTKKSPGPRYIFFDTETDGLPVEGFFGGTVWPHIVQIAWIIADSDGKPIMEASHIVRPPW